MLRFSRPPTIIAAFTASEADPGIAARFARCRPGGYLADLDL
jgi:hypothetical protein